MYKVICFDLWNTLVCSPGTGASYESVLTSLGVSTEQIFPFVRDYLMTQQMSYEEMTTSLFEHFSLKPTPKEREELSLLWASDNKQAMWIPGTLEVVRELRTKGLVVVLVTNSTMPGWNEVNRSLHLAREFSHLYISCYEGNVKPSNQVWGTIESWFPTITQKEFVMIGDRENDDLAVPRQRGWGTFQANEMRLVLKEKKR